MARQNNRQRGMTTTQGDGVLKDFWQGLGGSSKAGLVAGVAVLTALMIAAAAWLLRTEYEVLFAGLSAPDAAVMTAELDRMKLPYRLGGDGTSILVDRANVHQTRLKLLGKDIPLHGAVGFELFNNSDFGMTEFAQKINYQRALQGELTRTILSLAEVETARVHLAFPEEGLFRREQAKAKASVTLGLRQHQSLRVEQVNGIQRLISAAVPGVAAQDVTIVNTQGVALTRVVGPELAADANTRLDLKRDIEQYLVRKANDVLERSFGVGRALTSVDVTLNMNQVRVTTEDVTTPKPGPGEAHTGVIVRERESIKDDSPPLVGRDGQATSAASTHRETDYQVGRRVEQLVSQPGSIDRLQVLAVIKAPLNAIQLEHLRALVGAAVGLSTARGDVIVVQPLNALVGPTGTLDLPPAAAPGADLAAPVLRPGASGTVASDAAPSGVSSSLTTVLLALVAAAAVLAMLVQRWAAQRSTATAPAALNSAQREQALSQVRLWLDESAASVTREGGGLP